MPETASQWSYIIAAYAVTWVVLLGYAGYVHKAARTARDAFRRTSGVTSDE